MSREKEVRPGISNEPVSGFAEKLQTGFAVTVEIDLPRVTTSNP